VTAPSRRDLAQLWHAPAARRAAVPVLTELTPAGSHHHSGEDLLARVAHWVARGRAAGVQSGDRVVIRVPAGFDWVALVWACWELDAVWCPIPPDVPEQRAARQIAHADPRWIVHPDGETRATPSVSPCAPEAAYLIYTSGSTGEPKGVLVGTAGLPTLWATQAALFRMSPATVAGWMLSPAFDASLSDIGTALTVGARLVVVPKHHWRTHRAWWADMAREGITQLDAPPSWLALWQGKPRPPSLRTIVAGGEVTPAPVLRAWTPHVHWVNVYGPTEATVCTSAEGRHIGPDDAVPATLGAPFPGVTYRLQPAGAPGPFAIHPAPDEGELWIGGEMVALGYWRDPTRTAERFADVDGQRWFRTGDAVAQIHGDWHYRGRLDRQVKIRGQLLHLDEVETVLTAGADGAAIAVFLDARGRLIAALDPLCPASDSDRTTWEASLPLWGRPQRWFRPATWPRGPTGKTDRAALARAWEAL
jgi:non-ribosomal peptide synthetase component F